MLQVDWVFATLRRENWACMLASMSQKGLRIHTGTSPSVRLGSRIAEHLCNHHSGMRHGGEISTISGHYQLLDKLPIGLGYKFYVQDIDSADEDFFGDYRFEYRGPVIDIRARF